MKFSKRDTIVIAILVNVSLLFILFALAKKNDGAKEVIVQRVVQEESIAAVEEEKITPKAPVDEVDQVLQKFNQKKRLVVAEEPVSSDKEEAEWHIVRVKRGDTLQKIAKQYQTTSKILKETNELTSSDLRLGQLLRIPKKEEVEEKEENQVEPIYYTIKSGDNPWKLARKFHVKYDELLALNNLDEEKAKNLKVGQKIRIR